MAQMLLSLTARHDVALLYLRAGDEPAMDQMLQERCVLIEEVLRPAPGNSLVRRFSHSLGLLVNLLRGKPLWASAWMVNEYMLRAQTLARSWRPDIVQFEYHVMAQYLPALGACPAPRVLTVPEPGTRAACDRWKLHHGIPRAVLYLDMRAWREFERAIIQGVQTVVVFTERDRHELLQFESPTPVRRIPLCTVVPEHPLNPLGCLPWRMLFVGNFVHPPNVDAAIRLIGSIFPRVQARAPGARLDIVGDRPTARIRRGARKDVVVTGHVPDVTPYLDRAAVVVLPLRSGGGMRVKVLEALAAGKAIVASPLAVEGLDLIDGEEIVLAESDDQFCEATVRLLNDSEQRASVAARARAWARANFDWNKSIAAYEALYENLLDHEPATQQ
jgi:glycosyltransferase involved in cell wall biosynthesis